jgi:cytosine/adenosine deaminase-related metal-dependent hydrolase
MGNYDQGSHLVGRLHDADLLGPDLLFVRGAAFTDHELALLAHHGASISSTP